MSSPPTLVLLHGFTNTGASWRPVIRAMGERYRSLAPDIRGHGNASEVRPVSLDAVLRDIADLTPGPFVLAGYSMGGRIALHAALAFPDRIESLILIGASPGLSDPAEREARRAADERLADEIDRTDIESFARRWAQTPVLSGVPAQLAEQVHRDRLNNTPAGLAAALRGLGAGALPSLWDRLPKLTMPATLAAGERDQKFRAIAAQMAQRIPRSETAVIPGAGHAAHIEAPGEVARLLQSV
jgi:2-succinyl-6-hydroxy-2,4-cyclohexadiene-1-carboxylate synthase